MTRTERDKGLLLLSLAGLLAYFSYSMARNPILPLFAKDLGASAQLIGLVVGASTITGIFLKAPSGAVSDLVGRGRTLIAGGLVFALLPFFYILVGGPYSLILLRFIHGAATGIFGPVAVAAVADMFVARRAEAMSWYNSSRTAGNFLGPFLGGILITYFGFGKTFLASGVVGIMALAAIILFSRGLPAPAGNPVSVKASYRDLAQGLREAVISRYIIITSSMEAAHLFALGAVEAFLPLYAISVGLAPWQVGFLFGAQAVLALVSRPVMGRLSDRVGRRPFILTGLVLSAFSLVVIPYTERFVPLMALAALFGFGEALASSSTQALAADFSKKGSYGAAMGVFGTIADVGHASGPMVAGLLVGAFSFGPTFFIIAALLFMAAFYFFLSVPAFK